MPKPPTVAVVTPSRGTVQTRTAAAVVAATAAAEHAGAARLVSDWWCCSQGLAIPTSHEAATERAVATGAELLWFVEDDNVPPRDSLIASVREIERGADLVAVNYPCGTHTPRWGTVCRYGGEILFTGLGITLVHRRVFEKLERPWFRLDQRMSLVNRGGKQEVGLVDRPYRDHEGGVDVVFGLRMREAGFKLAEVPDMVGGHVRIRSLGAYGSNSSPNAVELWDTIDTEQQLFPGEEPNRGRWIVRSEPECEETFERLGPWISGFQVGTKHYGGKYDPIRDPRVLLCRDRFGDVKRVLELGSLEGGHTVALSRWADEVLGVEGREENRARARWVLELHEATNASVVAGDLQTMDLAALGEFDLCFSVGVLYHMSDPRRLLDQMAAAAPRLFLWTHVSRTGHEFTYHEGGLADPLSGLSDTSIWLGREQLLSELRERYDLVEVLGEDPRGSKPSMTIAAQRF